MSSDKSLRLIGGTASPYTMKMISLMRYRHIRYAVSWGMPDVILDKMEVERPKLAFMPTFLFDDDDGRPVATCDSSPIIRRLETMYDGRSVLPSDPASAFIDYLIEDFADEWVTKYMFHYRWYPQEDADNAGTLLPLTMNMKLSDEQALEFKTLFQARQISRLSYVGSSDGTAPVIEASYRRFLVAMQKHLTQQPYMLGDRPGAGDFALYGQLSQLVGFDPSSRRIAHEVSPRTVAWVDMLTDLSGVEPRESDWTPLEDQPETLRGLLAELGRVYVPALLANAQAVQAGEKMWSTQIDGQHWEQRSFPYQAKCLVWINEAHQALSDQDRVRVDVVLDGSGCEKLFNKAYCK
ncbi:MAG: glutathione S-transferase [Zhongshania sp.]|jgi:glutathione S-transferase